MKLIKTIAITFAAISIGSCSDGFLRNEPQGPLSEANMNDPKAVDLLVSGAYATFGCRYADSNDPHFFSITNWSHGEVRSDNAYKGGGGETDIWEFHDMETAKLQPNNGLIDGKWFNVYCGISRCNSAIRALRKVDESVNKDIKTRIAEVSVIRSFWYFDLVRQFNRIPYMDIDLPETEYVNVRNDEFTREEHLDRIAKELLDAAGNLPDSQPEIGRINRRSALALAAKVRLYQAYEEDPATNAVTNINKGLLQEVVDIIDRIDGYDLLADFQQLDMLEYENGLESVLAVQFSKDDGSGSVGRINWGNLLNSMTGPGCPWQGDGFFLPSQDLINAYQTDENGNIKKDENGFDISTEYSLVTNTSTDEEAYNDAMNKYNYEQYKYDQKVQDINAKIEIIQQQDKSLELELKQLDTEENAISTEMDAVKKVISKNIESTFKTFNA